MQASQVSDSQGEFVPAGSVGTFVLTPPDKAAPTPNPSVWATVPYATSATSIKMIARMANDPSGVQYDFVCLTAGGHRQRLAGQRDLPGHRPFAGHAIHV